MSNPFTSVSNSSSASSGGLTRKDKHEANPFSCEEMDAS
jgi:hypothetical protein